MCHEFSHLTRGGEKILKKLSDAQYRKLIEEYRFGNVAALEEILIASRWLVKKITSHYQGKDLILAGEGGLKKAVEKYDLSKDYKFLTYATWWIRAGIHKHLGLPVE